MSPSDDFLIVGLGASAGGVQALQTFFAHVPADCGMAFVVILHLSPDHESQLAEVLQGAASIPVHHVDGRVHVERDRIYVVSPRQRLAMSDGDVLELDATSDDDRRAPIDVFFRTLAEARRERAVSVVLSGTGADGSMGLKHVKELGGISLVQDPEEAEYGEMPRNAIATGLVDDIAKVSELPGRIIAYRDRLGAVKLPDEPRAHADDTERALHEIFAQLRLRTGHDFSNYKRATVMRRIERRLGVRQLSDLPSYAQFLRDYPEEAHALLKDLLISVTNFFRDAAAFTALEHDIVPRLFQGKTQADQVRVWVAGCATGEEAYSIGMLLMEHGAGTPGAPGVQIFATDIDEQAIATAREGLYTLNDAVDVSPERLRQFFTKEGERYRIRRELRELVLFANHNIIKDPPFSHLDLVSCRNLLIYFNGAAQQRVLDVVHFALKPGGYLFLGGAEALERVGDLFLVANKEAHILQSRGSVVRHSLPVPVPSFSGTGWRQGAPPPVASDLPRRERFAPPDLHLRLLERYAPPSLVINDEHDIVHLSEHAAAYLQLSGGEPSTNLLRVIRPELRLELRTALYQAGQNRVDVETRDLAVSLNDRLVTLRIVVRPVVRADDPARGFFLVLFEEVPASQATPPQRPGPELSTEPARQLEEQIIRLRSQLRTTVEQHETQAEELRASNEELQAINEELRSATEELETSKEELQSLNEELRTVNQELKVKVDEQMHSSNDLQNLINSTDIGTVFLQRSGRIKFFTPRARDLFNLIPADRGRPLADISTQLVGIDLHADTERVLDRLEGLEREVETRDGRWHLLRIGPYRTADDRIDGVVLTFVDITDRKRSTERVRLSEERLRRSLEIETVGVLYFQPGGRITDANDAFLRMSGCTRHDLRSGGVSWEMLAAPGSGGNLSEGLREFEALGRLLPRQVEHVRPPDGSTWWALCSATRVDDHEGVAFVVDVTEQRHAEASLRDADQRKNEFLATLAHELRNPLAPITTALQLLRMESVPPHMADRARDTIQRQVDHMVRLVDDLTEVSRITHGKIQLRRERVAIGTVAQTAIDSSAPRIEQARHRLSVHMPAEPLTVDVDPMRMAQVFANLLHNAAKYTPDEGEITLTAMRVGNDVRVAVRDTGVGIPGEVLPHVFELFSQGPHVPAGHTQTGLGLGLALVRSLVEAHGGRVEALSEGLGTGSEFAVHLPLASDGAAEPSAGVSSSPGDLTGKRVLVVDDNRDAAANLAAWLELLGANVVLAFDGMAGASMAEAHQPDAAVLDLSMPGMDGFELARAIRTGSHGADVTLVALTGRSRPQDREAATAAGFNFYFTKPASADQIRAALSGHIYRRSAGA